ncbi:MAG: DUF1995 family protein [Cyanobacteria bacterium P01_H01_bin.15]
MVAVPSDLTEAVAQAKTATQAALGDGLTRLQVELVVPEIALETQALALEFAEVFADQALKILFADTGAASLARRDWGDQPFQVNDLGSKRTPITTKVEDDDEAYLLAGPSSVEIEQVEKLCNLVVEKPVLLLIPQLENVAIVGIGLAARQLRERFLSTIESCYYYRPLEGAVVLRVYPEPWQVWQETEEGGYELLAETSTKPSGDKLNLILSSGSEDEEDAKPSAKGLFSGIQQFIRALSQ